MLISPDSFLALFGIVGTTTSAVLGTPYLYRKITARLSIAQVDELKARTDQIKSDTALKWIDKYNAQSDYLSDSDCVLIEHAAWDWMVMQRSMLEGWGLPTPPALRPRRRTTDEGE